MAMAPEIKVVVIGRETIKPSSPTPAHLKTYKLSILDQFVPPIYAPVLLFYAPTTAGRGAEKSHRLKQSLSKILTRFHHFAGRLNDPDLPTIDCNDDGACFLEARVNCTLSDVLEEPRCQVLKRFSPIDLTTPPVGSSPLLIVQATFFDCGGVALGISISHHLADGATLSAFAKAWADATLGRPNTVVPDLSAASLFPPLHPFPRNAIVQQPTTNKFIPRRLVFEAAKIASLKAKAASASVQRPTRFQVVSGLIWKCAVAASRSRFGFQYCKC